MVGQPKTLVSSSALRTTFLLPGFTHLPRSLSGKSSLSLGLPWIHIEAFHTSVPMTEVFRAPKAKSLGIGISPYPKFLAFPNKSD